MILTRKCRAAKHRRAGLSLIDLLIVLVVTGAICTMAGPLVLSWRETSRNMHCRRNLSQLGVALQAYHSVHGRLPPAAVWSTSHTSTLALHLSKQLDQFVGPNWVHLLLPHLSEDEIARQLRDDVPVGAAQNEVVRTATLPALNCPSDDYNHPGNMYSLQSVHGDDVHFARGNYAVNGGTQCYKTESGSTSAVYGDPSHLVMKRNPREFRLWGNGIAGFNVSFSLEDFSNGTSTLVALEEVRAGIHPLDLRGAWALGHIGASVTWGHGINGDDYGPNNPWPRSDDIQGCGQLHAALGGEKLNREGMPCVPYVDVNQNATARSLHEGGVNVAFMDGAVRFISNQIDPGLWHAMHSRETPAEVLMDQPEQSFSVTSFDEEAAASRRPQDSASATAARRLGEIDGKDANSLVNSLGMMFTLVPAGAYTMGIPDRGNRYERQDCPPHEVRITRHFYLGMHEVTRKQYHAIMSAAPTLSDSPSGLERTSADHGDMPVVDVTWDDASTFCERLSEQSQERAAGRWYRLPTEAEWEYACRSGKSEPYDWTLSRDTEDRLGEAAGSSPPLPLAPIGSYPPNEFGLYDMRGNAWEWTADWFDRDYYDRSPVEDPRGPARGYLKVVRGGDWRFIGEACHIDYPVMPPWLSNPFVGFRVVCEVHQGHSESAGRE